MQIIPTFNPNSPEAGAITHLFIILGVIRAAILTLATMHGTTISLVALPVVDRLTVDQLIIRMVKGDASFRRQLEH